MAQPKKATKKAKKPAQISKRTLKMWRKNQRLWRRAEKKCEDLRKLEDRAWKKYFPQALKRYKALPKANKGIWGDFLPEGISGTEIDLVDSAGQKVDFRVGPVFGKGGIYKEPGIWMGVQRRWLNSSRTVELLLSPNTWRRLIKEVEARLKEYDPKGYGPMKVISVKKKAKKGKKQQ